MTAHRKLPQATAECLQLLALALIRRDGMVDVSHISAVGRVLFDKRITNGHAEEAVSALGISAN